MFNCLKQHMASFSVDWLCRKLLLGIILFLVGSALFFVYAVGWGNYSAKDQTAPTGVATIPEDTPKLGEFHYVNSVTVSLGILHSVTLQVEGYTTNTGANAQPVEPVVQNCIIQNIPDHGGSAATDIDAIRRSVTSCSEELTKVPFTVYFGQEKESYAVKRLLITSIR